MFASLVSRHDGELPIFPAAVSNDQMRDHLAFRSLPGRSFELWRKGSVRGFEMDHPVDLMTSQGKRPLPEMKVDPDPACTREVQVECDSGWWHLPCRGGGQGGGPEWLSLRTNSEL